MPRLSRLVGGLFQANDKTNDETAPGNEKDQCSLVDWDYSMIVYTYFRVRSLFLVLILLCGYYYLTVQKIWRVYKLRVE